MLDAGRDRRLERRDAHQPRPAELGGLLLEAGEREVVALRVADHQGDAGLLGRGRSDHLRRAGQRSRFRDRPWHVPDPRGEQLARPVEGLGLHVLRQGDGHRPGLGRVGEHPHGPQ
jgi:hypothetical protein